MKLFLLTLSAALILFPTLAHGQLAEQICQSQEVLDRATEHELIEIARRIQRNQKFAENLISDALVFQDSVEGARTALLQDTFLLDTEDLELRPFTYEEVLEKYRALYAPGAEKQPALKHLFRGVLLQVVRLANPPFTSIRFGSQILLEPEEDGYDGRVFLVVSSTTAGVEYRVQIPTDLKDGASNIKPEADGTLTTENARALIRYALTPTQTPKVPNCDGDEQKETNTFARVNDRVNPPPESRRYVQDATPARAQKWITELRPSGTETQSQVPTENTD